MKERAQNSSRYRTAPCNSTRKSVDGVARRATAIAILATVSAASSVHADPLSSPSFSGPLQPNPNPVAFDAGPFGKVYVTGQLSGLGMLQNHTATAPNMSNSDALADISNAQVQIQTTDGPLQFYLQAGAYSLPALGTPYMRSEKTFDQLYGPVTVAYAKAIVSQELSISAGALPTLIGAESTFTFQNMNVERGLLWNQEPAISRGVQVNYANGPLSAAISVNDGYYSGKYNWVAGTVSYAIDTANTVSFVGGGSFSSNRKASFATPLVQNNSSIFNLIYTYSHGSITFTPYLQYSRVNRDAESGVDRGAETYGAAALLKYAYSSEWSLGARAEFLKSSGGGCGGDSRCSPTNFLYGVGSSAWSLTVTPSYQKGAFFARGELGYVRSRHSEPGLTFGDSGTDRDQVRALLEVGILF